MKKKGFTLIETLITTGFISISSLGAYAMANIAVDWRKSNQEVKSLNALISSIENSTSTQEDFKDVSYSSLAFNSSLNLAKIEPINKKLNFVYQDIGSRVCNDFVGKMLTSSKNIGSIVNGLEFSKENIKNIAISCQQDKNDITIVLNKQLNDYSINTVVASVNPPPAPVPEMELPTVPTPASWTPPEPFTASTAVPTTYPITTTTPPALGPVIVGGGPISVVSPPGTVPQGPKVPAWTPPAVPIPPATGHRGDEIDQDPNPPAPPPPAQAPDNSQGGTLYKCRSSSANSFEIFKFSGKSYLGYEFSIKDYYSNFGGLGAYQSGIQTYYNDILSRLKNNQDLAEYKNTYCTQNLNQWT
jgi:type II secretory pathway pseudopilin PulG